MSQHSGEPIGCISHEWRVKRPGGVKTVLRQELALANLRTSITASAFPETTI